MQNQFFKNNTINLITLYFTYKEGKKMKTKIFTVIFICLPLLLIISCGGKRYATLKTDKDGTVTHEDWNISFLQLSVSPLALAESYRIKKQADTYEKMMTGLQEGRTVAANSGKFLIGLINNSPSRGVYLFHPEIPGMKLIADPNGGFQIFEVRDMPYEIAIYEMNGKLAKQIRPRYEPDYEEKIAHKKLVGNLLVDFVIKVNGTY